MGTCTITMKVILVAISFVFWVVAAGFFFVGGYVFHTYNNFENFTTSTITLIPATIMLAIGVVMFIVGLVGCLAVGKESRFILACFFTMVLVILLLEMAAAVLAFAYSRNNVLGDAVKNELNKALEHYNNSSEYRHEMDYVQKKLHCCGVTNYTDWQNAGMDMPQSCYPSNSTANKTRRDFYHVGCETKLEKMFKQNLIYIAVVSAAVGAIEVLCLFCTCVLFCRNKNRDNPYSSLTTNAGLTV